MKIRIFFLLLLPFAIAACKKTPVPTTSQNGPAFVEPIPEATGHFLSRPSASNKQTSFGPGLHTLNTESNKTALFYIPTTYSADKSSAFIVMLHGSTGDAAQSMSILRKYADDHNFILYAPPSTTYTWDLVNPGRYEKDVVQINNGLDLMFRNFNLDTAKIAIAGFSDGASYALSLGLTNGDLFTHVIAFSPGFIRFKNATGKPKIFISHGEDDTVLSIGLSRAIVEQLNSRSFELNYVEFSGTHGVPGDISRTAIDWFKK